MIIRWTPTGSDDLETIFDFIAQDSPDKARQTVQRIVSEINALTQFPFSGRKGVRAGTLELISPPYVVIYHLTDEVVEIIHIIHGARRWPLYP